jgi:hypothetical protein
MKSHLWIKSYETGWPRFGGSDAPTDDATPSPAQTPGADSCKAGASQLYARATPKPSASPVHAAHAEFVATLTGHAPRTIPLDADAIDLEDRADHLSKVFRALSVYLAIILDDTAQNVPGGLDLRDAEGLLADLAADLTGAIQRAADSMAGWLA